MKITTKKAVLVLCTAILFALPLNAFAYTGLNLQDWNVVCPDKPETNTPGENNPGTEDGDTILQDYEQKVVTLVNAERSRAGLSPLKVNDKLSNVAELKAEDMRDNKYFSHTSPTYGSPFEMMQKYGIKYRTAGENIAKGQKSPEAVMNGWMNSSGHKANILNSAFTEIGVGYVTDSNNMTYWVQMFITL